MCKASHYPLHNHKVSRNSVERFQRSCADKKTSSIFHFGQISKFRKGVTPRKKLNQNFLWICTSTHYVLHNYKVSRNSVERFQKSCTNKKNRSIFHFGLISKFKKGVTPRKKMESKFPVDMRIYTLCPSLLQSFRKFC